MATRNKPKSFHYRRIRNRYIHRRVLARLNLIVGKRFAERSHRSP